MVLGAGLENGWMNKKPAAYSGPGLHDAATTVLLTTTSGMHLNKTRPSAAGCGPSALTPPVFLLLTSVLSSPSRRRWIQTRRGPKRKLGYP
jgi:hypothetical protein